VAALTLSRFFTFAVIFATLTRAAIFRNIGIFAFGRPKGRLEWVLEPFWLHLNIFRILKSVPGVFGKYEK
jgi:hypothetical protein